MSILTDKLKGAFDGIRAEDSLKINTTRFLHAELQRRSQRGSRTLLRRPAAALASFAVLLLLSCHLYFAPGAYVDVDVNPSVALTLNRFDRVIGVQAYNGEGETMLADLSLRHRSYQDALVTLIEAFNRSGYLQNDALVSVTLQTDQTDRELVLLQGIQTGVEGYVAGHGHGAEVSVFSVSSDTRSNAYAQDLSPAKYLAIQELIETDPTASVESCRGHSIREIQQWTQVHGSHHGSAAVEGSVDGYGAADGGYDGAVSDSQQHHGRGGGNHGGHRSR